MQSLHIPSHSITADIEVLGAGDHRDPPISMIYQMLRPYVGRFKVLDLDCVVLSGEWYSVEENNWDIDAAEMLFLASCYGNDKPIDPSSQKHS